MSRVAAGGCWPSSAPIRKSTSRSSPPMPASRSSWSASPTRSRAGDRFLLTFDNHNSVNGIREFDRARGARDDLRSGAAARAAGRRGGARRELARARPGGHNLFAYPAQSNFSGVQHPLEWIARAQARGWDVLLDAAAFVPSNRLDLSRGASRLRRPVVLQDVRLPDRRRRASRAAQARWRSFTAPGSPAARSPSPRCRRTSILWPKARRPSRTARSTTPSCPAVEYGLDLLDSVGIECDPRTGPLPDRLALSELPELRHGNGAPSCGSTAPEPTDRRGGTVDPQLLRLPAGASSIIR